MVWVFITFMVDITFMVNIFTFMVSYLVSCYLAIIQE